MPRLQRLSAFPAPFKGLCGFGPVALALGFPGATEAEAKAVGCVYEALRAGECAAECRGYGVSFLCFDIFSTNSIMRMDFCSFFFDRRER
ncbi:MAG: hypothetical protein BWY63_02109 [Chloroflexi bacterium ADurb.Bin360]|nr:MAG: hypothetical protein BWY63_02109 [Chloroflexi bacterium ADurb.Bin360]